VSCCAAHPRASVPSHHSTQITSTAHASSQSHDPHTQYPITDVLRATESLLVFAFLRTESSRLQLASHSLHISLTEVTRCRARPRLTARALPSAGLPSAAPLSHVSPRRHLDSSSRRRFARDGGLLRGGPPAASRRARNLPRDRRGDVRCDGTHFGVVWVLQHSA